MFDKIFSIPAVARQSFSNSQNSFNSVLNSANDFVTHGTNAVSALPELGNQVGMATVAGGTAAIGGAGLWVASAIFFPAGFIASGLGVLGWSAFAHPFSMIGGANVISLINKPQAVTTFGSNSLSLAKDAVMIPTHAAIGTGQVIKATGQVAYNSFNETVKVVRTPDQKSVYNDGQGITFIEEKEMDKMFHNSAVEISFKSVESTASDEIDISGCAVNSSCDII